LKFIIFYEKKFNNKKRVKMFKGVGTALITPFDKNSDLDYTALRKIIQFQLNGGVDALIILGTTGESPVINVEERKKILSISVEEVNGRIPVIIGTGTNDTKKVVELNKIAEEYKADGVLIVNPYYNKGTQESLVEHYKYIAERTSLPIVLYNVPSRTAMNILPETAVKIHEQCPNVVAIKEASGNISQIAQLMSIKPDSFTVYSGNDDQTLSIMAHGGAGIVSVLSNAYPREMKRITDALFANDLASAQQFNNLYLRMMNLLFVETSPAPIKYVMSKLGLSENIIRLPLIKASKKTEELLEAEMKRLAAFETVPKD
jgi:4-hydroxy-tetrahydrodipicolinate synthase